MKKQKSIVVGIEEKRREIEVYERVRELGGDIVRNILCELNRGEVSDGSNSYNLAGYGLTMDDVCGLLDGLIEDGIIKGVDFGDDVAQQSSDSVAVLFDGESLLKRQLEVIGMVLDGIKAYEQKVKVPMCGYGGNMVLCEGVDRFLRRLGYRSVMVDNYFAVSVRR